MAAKPINPPGKNGFTYREQFGIVVMCHDEAHQQKVFEELRKLGYKLKVVSV